MASGTTLYTLTIVIFVSVLTACSCWTKDGHYRYSSTHKRSSSDIAEDRRVRVWNDENLACIIRHCFDHQKDPKKYVNCVSENCRRGTLQIPRDLSESQDFPAIMDNLEDGSDQQYGFDSLENDRDIFNMADNDMVKTVCYDKYCSKHNNIMLKMSCLLINCDFNQKNSHDNDIERLAKHSRSRLGELTSEIAMLNMADGKKETSSMAADYDSSDVPKMVGKRRVNDEVSQCIQSYCGGNSPSDRVLCIVKHCHRSSTIYK